MSDRCSILRATMNENMHTDTPTFAEAARGRLGSEGSLAARCAR